MTKTAPTAAKIKKVTIILNGERHQALRRDLPPAKLASGWGSLVVPTRQYSIDGGKTWFDAR